MYQLLCKDVEGHIDKSENLNHYEGWCYHKIHGILPLRIAVENTFIEINVVERIDVVKFFNRPDIKDCGWSVDVGQYSSAILQMKIDTEWKPIFVLKSSSVQLFAPYTVPSFVVVDNFYKDPDAIRNFALQQNFQENPAFHKGKRCINPAFRFPGLKEQFERILGVKIKGWDSYATNGCFQYCIAGDQAVYHSDVQQYAGVLFLTPDAPPQTGTQFFRSNTTKKMKSTKNEYNTVYKTGHLDSTQFETVDVVGNVYNRIVLFDAHMIHSAPLYFGTDKTNSRLFQLFFFDIDT